MREGLLEPGDEKQPLVDSMFPARGATERFRAEAQFNKGGNGRDLKFLNKLKKREVLALDDWSLSTLTQAQREDIFQILDTRVMDRERSLVGQEPIV